MEVVFPRIVLAEFNTHRMFSRNSASSRAIPVEKMISMVREHPYVPTEWPKNQKGMSASENLENTPGYWPVREAEEIWLLQRDEAVKSALGLLRVGVHKQITNRLLEPFMWHTVIVTATEWSNFFNLRCHPAAHPEIRKVAELMRDALAASTPVELKYGEWHLPLIDEQDIAEAFKLAREMNLPEEGLPARVEHSILVPVSVGRCARVSYLTHDGKRDHDADIKLHDDLLKNGHMSPFEHVARPMGLADTPIHSHRYLGAAQHFSGNFRGWISYRKTIPHEEDILGQR
jgi:thymidylate synthase ThyX